MMLYHPTHARFTNPDPSHRSVARQLPNSGDGDFYAIGISACGSKRQVPIPGYEPVVLWPHVCECSTSSGRSGFSVILDTSPSSKSGRGRGRYGDYVSRSEPRPGSLARPLEAVVDGFETRIVR